MHRTLGGLSIAAVGSSSMIQTDDIHQEPGVGVSSSDEVSTPNTPSVDA